jgi:trk system potassium uptake protein
MKLKLSPPRILAVGFLSVILTGALLLMLPISNVGGCSFVDALFTSTSAVCVTGLIVKDTPRDFTLFGQVVIMLLIQIGGLGYMTSATIISLILGKKIGISERLAIKEGLNFETVGGIVKFAKGVVMFTMIFEICGCLALMLRFLHYYSLKDALLLGIFHSVSSFNNAGFSLFSDNLIRFRGDVIINLVITSLIIVGGIGFIVVGEIFSFSKKETKRLSQHSKIVLYTTAILIAGGMASIYLLELSNPRTFAAMPFGEQMLASYFASVTPRTAGFNTMDYSLLRQETLFLTIVLMFIGASPGSTGGGVKTSTFTVVLASLYATVRGMRNAVLFKRRVPADTVAKSFLLITTAAILCTIGTHFIITTQHTPYLSTMFEITSAFGTVGLSVGDGGVRSLSALFTPAGKLAVSLTMFLGRLGPLTLAVAITRKADERFRYAEGSVLIG